LDRQPRLADARWPGESYAAHTIDPEEARHVSELRFTSHDRRKRGWRDGPAAISGLHFSAGGVRGASPWNSVQEHRELLVAELQGVRDGAQRVWIRIATVAPFERADRCRRQARPRGQLLLRQSGGE